MSKEVCQGIVLRKINYSDTSLIVKILTRENGVQSFLFQGGKRKNKHGNILQPLALISAEYYQRNDSDMPKMSAVNVREVYRSIPFDPFKSSVLFFLAEIIQKTVHENETDEALFDFIENSLLILDETEHYSNFVVKFLLQYPKYLGFSLFRDPDPQYFDYQEAGFVKNIPSHPYYLTKEKSSLLLAFSGMKFDGLDDPKIDLNTRRELIHDLLKVYKVFFDNFKDIQSLSVLEVALH